MRKKKHFYTVVCLIAGVILLTTAAAANYGNANGYSLYKSALKKVFYTDNFTASLKVEVIYDGETTDSLRQTYKLNAKGEVLKYNFENDSGANLGYESWVVKNNANSKDEPKYLQISKNDDKWTIYPSYGEPWEAPDDSELMGKTVRFVELLADTFIGGIKNNFVQTSNNDGVVSYQVILSGNQLPEYISAGLSMIFSASKEGSGSYIYYDKDFDHSKDENGEVGAEVWELLNDTGNQGVVYIAADRTLHYFESRAQYFDSKFYEPDMSQINDVLNIFETEPIPESAKCYITLDEEGRLLSNVIEGVLSAYDRFGTEHTLGLRITADLKDYGTTQIEPPEIPEDATIFDYSKPTLESKDVDDTEYIEIIPESELGDE